MKETNFINTTELLKAAIIERHRQKSIISSLENEVESKVRSHVYEKYVDKEIEKDGIVYRVMGCRIQFSCYTLTRYQAEIELHWFAIDNIPKKKIARVDKAFNEYRVDLRMPWNTFKIPLWFSSRYSIDIDRFISCSFNLKLE